MVNVKGKWALVTGAARGLGRLASLFMAEQGCNLILQAREVSHLDSVVNELLSLGVEVKAVACDLASEDSVRSMLAEIDSFGVNVEIVLNNAGMQIAYRTDYYQTPVNDYLESFKVNTIAPAIICYHFLPKMIDNGFGRIVNTTSGIALEPEQAGYSASKAALDKITIDLGSKLQRICLESDKNVLINLTDPGWCRTDLGGPKAPNSPESAIPGIVLGAFVDDGNSGRLFPAALFTGLSLDQAVAKAEAEFKAPY